MSSLRSIASLFVLLTLLVSAPLGVAAQDAAAEGAAEAGETPGDRATSFRAVSGSEAEEVPGGTLMLVSYGLIWLFLMLYVLRVGRQGAEVRREVDRLEKAIAEASEKT